MPLLVSCVMVITNQVPVVADMFVFAFTPE